MAASVLIILGMIVPDYLSGEMQILPAVLLSVAVALPIWIYLSTYYVVSGGQLVIRTGIFTWKIQLSEINSAKLSRSLWSSPALSLNRIELRYSDGKRVLVSPENSNEFLQAIGHGNTAI